MSSSKSIQITKEEAINLQWKLIRTWNSKLDTWPYTYGIGALAGLSSLSGILVNRQFRKAVNLGSEFRRAAFLPNAVFPALCCGVFHGIFVSSTLLIQDYNCLPCLETRAIAIQLGFGVAFPLFLAPMTSFMISRHYYTYDTPLPWEFKKMFNIWWSITKKFQAKLNILTLVHITAAAIITHQETSAIDTINKKLDNMLVEKSMEHKEMLHDC
ncbi:hypothetical protein CHUAL_010236 [Chamberlinius hualienensis]